MDLLEAVHINIYRAHDENNHFVLSDGKIEKNNLRLTIEKVTWDKYIYDLADIAYRIHSKTHI